MSENNIVTVRAGNGWSMPSLQSSDRSGARNMDLATCPNGAFNREELTVGSAREDDGTRGTLHFEGLWYGPDASGFTIRGTVDGRTIRLAVPAR